ncbi:hypothetical protein CCH79_00014246 [Gambusia affinis]|uniref:Uncharacterized protein n=1 Tax=Gambusia affinis TaxID=33528 RepID=A0A315UVZ4_GAMAF|nr:hypothetical protein CCH79_00014246 [Gambusia affinis]
MSGTFGFCPFKRQQVFPDGGSSDVTLNVDLKSSASQGIPAASLFITSNRVNATSASCTSVGDTFNPFNMKLLSSSCSLQNQLSCAVGEFSARQGNVSLTGREVYTDSNIQLSGDHTGDVRSDLLSSVKTSELMGPFRESTTCTRSSAGQLVLPEIFLLCLMFAAAFLLPSAASL